MFGIVSFVFLLLVFIFNQANGQDIQTFNGADGQIAFQSEDAEIIANGNSLVLSGGSGVASIFFLFKVDRGAEKFNIVVDYHGDAQVEVIDTMLSTKEDARSYIFPINGKDNNNGKRVISFSDPISRVVNQDYYMEIHISSGPSKCITLNSISIEYIYPQEKQKETEVRVVNRYYGVMPPGYSYSVLNYYHHGPIWVWDGYGYSIYDGWWYAPIYTQWVRVYYPVPVYRYYYHYCGEQYVAEKYIHHRGGNNRSDRRERNRTVESGKRTKFDNLFDGKENQGAPAKEKSALEVRSEAKKGRVMARKLSQEAIYGLNQQGASQQNGSTRRVEYQAQQEKTGAKKISEGAQNFVGRLFNNNQPKNDSARTAPSQSQQAEKKMPNREVRQQPTRQQQAQPAPTQTQQQPERQKRTEAPKAVVQQSSSTSTSSSASKTDDDEQNKKRRRSK